MLILLVLTCRLQFHEDIFDFLPQDEEYTESMRVYSELSEASRIVVIFEGAEPDSIVMSIDAFGEKRTDAITELDVDGFLSRLDYVYAHLPYFLTDRDYVKLAHCLQNIDSCLTIDRQMLSMPGTSFLGSSISSDPLRLIPISMGASGQYAGVQSSFDAYNGYMMTADHSMGFAFFDSPYGSTESARNGLLVDSLSVVCEEVMADFPTVNIRLLGSPVIAVGNARQIKHDSFIAILMSLILIALLLLYAFPRRRDMSLIALSVSFGWLFGMGVLGATGMKVSVIVLGIGAILIGIAVNYPLHLLVHQRYTSSIRQTLQEVLSPLVVGNITTIGAFMALLPMASPALRQLGIFAGAMLIGTILFCIIFLPHLMSSVPTPIRELHLPFANRFKLGERIARLQPILTVFFIVIFGILSIFVFRNNKPIFDANLSNINFMTTQQHLDFAFFESLSPTSDEPAYLASTAREELEHRLQLWDTFWTSNDADSVADALRQAAIKNGFRSSTFEPFCTTISSAPLSVNLSDPVQLASVWPGRFDTKAMNNRVASALSANFDYLGMVCSLIVLLFLSLSFRSLVLGLIAFLPMMISWIFIFACMYVFNLQFNIVNIILATFIFGQGDDYTIFVVEGLIQEYKTGRKILPQYKQSIILSALIMLLAIGVLVFAKHPAMHSLGAVTLIGMTCVVLMAYLVPPILFKFILQFRFFRERIYKL